MARTCTWDGGGVDALASNGVNWDTDVAPVAGDSVVVPTTTKSMTWDLNISLVTFTVNSGYVQTITQSSGANLLFTSTFTVNGACTITCSASATFTSAGFSLTTGTFNQGGAFVSTTFALTNAAIYTGSSATMSTTAVTYANTSALTATSGTWTLAGSWTRSNTATFTHNSGVINITAAATITDTGATFSRFNITTTAAQVTCAASTTMPLGASPSTTVTTSNFVINGTVTYSGTWTHVGVINAANGSTVTGSSTPAILLDGGLTIGTTATWTSVNVTWTGNINGSTYTDTGAKNTGTWTINKSGTNVVVAASTAMALGASPTTSVTAGTFTNNGTVTFSGNWTHTGSLSWANGCTVTGTSTPTLAISITLTLGTTPTITNAIGTITFNGGTAASITDTGDKLSGSICVINKTNANFVIAANTTVRLGTNPTTNVGTAQISNNGTILYSGLWTSTGTISVVASSTTTGTGSPSIAIDGSLTINASVTSWTSVNISTFGTTNTGTYTDTGAKNSGTWTLVKTAAGGHVLAASTTMALGASPTLTFGTGTLTLSGTLTFSGELNFIGGSLSTSNGSTITGTGTPTMTLQRTITIGATTTITNTIGTINITGTVAGTTFTDTGGALASSVFVINKTNLAFTVAASTSCNFGTNPTPSCGTNIITITGTAVWVGSLNVTGTMAVTGTLTATGSPTLTINQSLTTSAATITNPISTVTFSGSAQSVYTDTGDKLNAATFFITKTNNNFTISASTTCRVGANPTMTAGNAQITVSGTLIWSGLINFAALTVISSTGVLTGTVSPTILHSLGGFTITAGAVITNPISAQTFSSTTFGATFTDTADVLSAGCITTVSKFTSFAVSNNFTIAASTICRFGANPTIGALAFTVSGTMTFSGNWILNGSWTVSAGATVTGTSSPTLAFNGDITFSATATLTNAIPTATLSGTRGSVYTDTGDKLSGTTFTINLTDVGIVVSASTTMRLGSNPTSTTGTGTITCTGTINVSGVWSLNGGMLVTSGSGSVTGALTALTFTKRLNLTGALAWPTTVAVTWNVTQSGTLSFTGGGFSFGAFRITGTFAGGSTITVGDSSSFTSWRDNDGTVAHTVTFAAGSTQSVGTWILGGGSGHILTFTSSSPGSPYTLHSTGSATDYPVDFISFTDCTVDTTPTWHAGTHCVDVSGNINIIFREDIPMDADVRASLGLRTVQAIRDHPSGIVVTGDVVYALEDIIIYVPNPADPTRAYEYPFDELHFPDYFVETSPAGPVTVTTDILTFEAFDATRRTQLGARQVRATQDSPTGLFATNDVIYAVHKFAIWIQNPMNADEACRFDFDGGLFDDYFEDV